MLTCLEGESSARSRAFYGQRHRQGQHQDICAATGENASLNWPQQGEDEAVFEPGRILKLHLHSAALAGYRAEHYSRRVDAQFMSALIAPDSHRVDQHCAARWGVEGRLKCHRPFNVAAA